MARCDHYLYRKTLSFQAMSPTAAGCPSRMAAARESGACRAHRRLDRSKSWGRWMSLVGVVSLGL